MTRGARRYAMKMREIAESFKPPRCAKRFPPAANAPIWPGRSGQNTGAQQDLTSAWVISRSLILPQGYRIWSSALPPNDRQRNLALCIGTVLPIHRSALGLRCGSGTTCQDGAAARALPSSGCFFGNICLSTRCGSSPFFRGRLGGGVQSAQWAANAPSIRT